MEKVKRLRVLYKVLVILSIISSIIVICLGIARTFINTNVIFLIAFAIVTICLFGIVGFVKNCENKETCDSVMKKISNELEKNNIDIYIIRCSITEEKNAILANLVLKADIDNVIYSDCYNVANKTLDELLGYKNKYVALNFNLIKSTKC